MAKLFSSIHESRALRGLCSRNSVVSGSLLGALDDTFFHTQEGKSAYIRIRSYFERKGNVPEFALLCDDIGLSEETREFLRNSERPPKTIADSEDLLHQLDSYRKTRLLFALADGILNNLKKPRVDTERLLMEINERVARLQTRRGSEAEIITMGVDSNVLKHAEEILYNEETDDVIPTGFKTWDSVNGGLFRGSLVIIGGSSGSGKSIIANQLNINQAELGYKTSLAPLEMAGAEMLSRTMSNLSGMSSIDIFLKRLASGERDLVYRRLRRADKRIAAAGGKYTIFKPKEDLTAEQLLASMDSIQSDLVYIDYITLLAGADGDEQWKKLGSIARLGKVYAERTNRVVVMLAQVNEDGKLKYSQTVKEHASVAWSFVATKESKEQGYLNVDILKSRNQVDKPFTLKIDYGKMLVTDMTPEDLNKIETVSKNSDRQRTKGGNFKQPTDYTADLNE
jgi:archaellum biogenesis ATPase FlaH